MPESLLWSSPPKAGASTAFIGRDWLLGWIRRRSANRMVMSLVITALFGAGLIPMAMDEIRVYQFPEFATEDRVEKETQLEKLHLKFIHVNNPGLVRDLNSRGLGDAHIYVVDIGGEYYFANGRSEDFEQEALTCKLRKFDDGYYQYITGIVQSLHPDLAEANILHAVFDRM